MHRKILAIAAALMIGLAANGAALARGGGGSGGGHMGSFGGVHVGGGLGGAHLVGIGAGLGVGHFGGAHLGGLGSHAMGRGLNDGGLIHSHVMRDHVRALYNYAPLYDNNGCDLPDYMKIDSTVCDVSGE
jgi:hypothetical protein